MQRNLSRTCFSDVFSRFIKRNSFLFRLILAPKKDYFNAPSLILFLFALNVVQHVSVCFLHFHVSLFIVCLSVCFYTVYFSSSDIFSVMYSLFAAYLLFCLLCTIVFLFHLFRHYIFIRPFFLLIYVILCVFLLNLAAKTLTNTAAAAVWTNITSFFQTFQPNRLCFRFRQKLRVVSLR